MFNTNLLQRRFFSTKNMVDRDLHTSGERNITLGISEADFAGRLQQSGVAVHRLENLASLDISNGVLVATTTLCPHYAHGGLESSRLVEPPEGFFNSRVAIKWHEGLKVYKAIQGLLPSGVKIKVLLTFADLGVIAGSGYENGRLENTLLYHEQLYRQAATMDLDHLGIEWEFQRYSDLKQDFPRTIGVGNGPQADLAGAVPQVLERLNGLLCFDESVISPEGGLSRRGRKIINSMVGSFGPELTAGFLQQYGTFDSLTTVEKGINIFFERGELLLNVTNLFPHKRRPRLDILCK